MTEFERQQRPAKGPAQPDAPEEADSSSYIMLWLVILYSLLSITGIIFSYDLKKMAPKETTRSIPATTTNPDITTSSVTNSQLKAMIDQGVTVALAARNADR
ncbi:hypothetical protein Tco_1331215, partial [Tanacetum coccineum]